MFGDYIGYFWLNNEQMTDEEAVRLAKSFLKEIEALHKAHMFETFTSDDSEDDGSSRS